MSQFVNFLGAARGCADFCDPAAVFRFKRIYDFFVNRPNSSIPPFLEKALPLFPSVLGEIRRYANRSDNDKENPERSGVVKMA